MEFGVVISLISGMAGGWIVNYLADILPATRRLSQPACYQCNSPLAWRDYLLLRRCRSCGTPRRVRTFAVFILFIFLNVYFWSAPPRQINSWLSWVLLMYFTTVFVIDLEHRLILHSTSVFGAALGLGIGFLRQGPASTLIGGAVGFGMVYLFYLFGALFTKIRARRLRAAGLEPDDEDAFGAGDVILATILGLMLGWPVIWFGVLFGVLLGGVISVMIIVGLALTRRFKSWNIFIAFGPFFIISAFLILYLPEYVRFLLPVPK